MMAKVEGRAARVVGGFSAWKIFELDFYYDTQEQPNTRKTPTDQNLPDTGMCYQVSRPKFARQKLTW